MSVMSVANQHNVFSSYGAVHMQRQLISHPGLHTEESTAAAQQAAAVLAVRDEQQEARQVSAASTENKAHGYDKNTSGSSYAPAAGGAGGSGTLEPDATPTGGTPEQARLDLPQLGAVIDLYL